MIYRHDNFMIVVIYQAIFIQNQLKLLSDFKR